MSGEVIAPSVFEVAPGIHCIDLQFGEQSQAIAVYVLQGPNGVALVDIGPASTLPQLVRGLEALYIEPKDVREILLTHIHLDHAGGIGTFLARKRDVRVWVHPLGIEHLINPFKLIVSATRVFGDQMADLWGPIEPVQAGAIAGLNDRSSLDIAGFRLEIDFTPGHANHHVSGFIGSERLMFAGDVLGVRRPTHGLISPPTVPPEFDLKLWENSLSRIEEYRPDRIALAHFGCFNDVSEHIQVLRRRLRDWVDFVEHELNAGRTESDIAIALQIQDGEAATHTHIVANYGSSVRGIARYLSRKI